MACLLFIFCIDVVGGSEEASTAPPQPCTGAIKRLQYVSMTRDSSCSSSSSNPSPHISRAPGDDPSWVPVEDSTYDILPPKPKPIEEAEYCNVQEITRDVPPILPPKKNIQRQDSAKIGLSSIKVGTDSHRKKPVPKPRVSIQPKPKPVPMPRRIKGSIKISGTTCGESSDDPNTRFKSSMTPDSVESVYEEIANTPSEPLSHLLVPTSSSFDELDVSKSTTVNWNLATSEKYSIDQKEQVLAGAGDIDEIDDDYVPPDIGIRPPSGGGVGQDSPPNSIKHKACDLNYSVNVMPVEHKRFEQPMDATDQRVVIGVELSKEESENVANENAEQMPGVNNEYDRVSSGVSYGQVWDMKSGSVDDSLITRALPLISPASSTSSYENLGDPPPPPNFSPAAPPGSRKQIESEADLSQFVPAPFHRGSLDVDIPSQRPCNRASIVSFNEPPPAYAPPPLPSIGIMSPEPPEPPPRPCPSRLPMHKAVAGLPLKLQDFDSIDVTKPPNTEFFKSPPVVAEKYFLVNEPTEFSLPSPKPVYAPYNRQESEFSSSSSPFFQTTAGFGEFPGNMDSVNLHRQVSSSSLKTSPPPPQPPPKVNAFGHMYDASRGTYCLQDTEDGTLYVIHIVCSA